MSWASLGFVHSPISSMMRGMEAIISDPKDASRNEQFATGISDQFRKSLVGGETRYTALPYLFLGSGVSRRYLGLPDWPGLLRMFANEIDVDFDYHLSSAGGDFPKTAELIAHEFHEKWWTEPRFADQVEMHRGTFTTKDGALKAAVADYISQSDELEDGKPGVDDIKLVAEIQLLRRAVVDGVITTNFDALTDQLFPDFKAYVGQDGLLFSDAQFIGETYKIHGSASEAQSLVLTTADYTEFEDRNPYLAAKLLTIFAEHPVLFIGYSLRDEYLGRILESIARAAGPDRVAQLGERIFFVEWEPDESTEPFMSPSVIQRGDITLPITLIRTNSFAWLWQVLSRLDRPFPAKVLRQLRNHVKELISHPEPGQEIETVRAIPIDGDTGSEYRVVFGVGAFSEPEIQQLSTLSARTLSIQDLLEDALESRRPRLDPEWVLKHGIPGHIRPTKNQYVPVYSYLFKDGRIAPDGTVDYSGLDPIIQTLAERELRVPSDSSKRFRRIPATDCKSPKELFELELPLYVKLDCIHELAITPEYQEELRALLVGTLKDGHPELSGLAITAIRRAICQYERLVLAGTLRTLDANAHLP